MDYIWYLFLVSFLLLVIFRGFISRERRKSINTSMCQRPRFYPHRDPFLGLDLLFQTANLMRLHKIIPAFAEWHKTCGETFVVNSLGTHIVHTLSPQNIEVIFGTGLAEWGVSPARLKAMQPLCGLGFINTDGEDWRHSRAMIQPAFAESNITDLPPFTIVADEILSSFPTDGSTIDLSQYLYELVGESGRTNKTEY